MKLLSARVSDLVSRIFSFLKFNYYIIRYQFQKLISLASSKLSFFMLNYIIEKKKLYGSSPILIAKFSSKCKSLDVSLVSDQLQPLHSSICCPKIYYYLRLQNLLIKFLRKIVQFLCVELHESL